MTGAIVDGRTLRGAVRLDADVVVCGGGAGGSMAARELSKQGLRVVLLEEGTDHKPENFTQREERMLPQMFQELGGRRTDDLGVLVLSGRGLGGSTAHNTNLSKRTHPGILRRWVREFGLDEVAEDRMAPLFEEVERMLGVKPIDPFQVNAGNRRFRRGVEQLGYAGGILSHNRDERCIGSGFCELGCAYDGKLNARRVLIPSAVELGVRVYTSVYVERVVHKRGQVSGVRAAVFSASGRHAATLDIRARAVCLAGSAVGSAGIALRSELPDPYDRLGRSLRLHPAPVIAGIFEDRIDAWRGIPQSYECTEFLELDREGAPDQKRVWILPSFAHPVGTASITPGFGPALMTRMRSYPRYGVLSAVLHDETEGKVYLKNGRPKMRYAPNAADRAQLELGSREAARILFAAGAREVMVPAAPEIALRSERDLSQIDARRFVPNDVKLTAVHPMGTMRMGADPTKTVVTPEGEHHQVRGLYAVDGSLFPTSIGGPPQISIYTFGMYVARRVAAHLRARA
jgi:choline dehydrogenase-like flavoprotein